MGNTQCLHKDDRLLIQEVTADSKTILIANCYAPQSTLDKVQLYRHVRSIIEEQNKDDHPIILLGDFNSVMSNELDIITGAPHSHREMEALNQLAVDLDLQDSWRLLHPEDKEYTWSRNQPFTASQAPRLYVCIKQAHDKPRTK